MIKIREGKLAGCDLINIYMLEELRGICLEDDGSILIRPLTSFTDVSMHPVIREHVPSWAMLLTKSVDPRSGISAPSVETSATASPVPTRQPRSRHMMQSSS